MIIYFDTETTGLYPGEICQLSYVKHDKNGALGKNFYFSVDNVEYGAYRVHGLTVPILRELSNGKRFSDFVDEIKEDFESAEIVVAHNSAFDFMFMREEFSRCGFIFSVKREFCSMKKSTPICKIYRSGRAGYKYPKLEELCEYFDIRNWQIESKANKLFGEVKGYHDARFDTTALYMCMVEGIKSEEKLKELAIYL